MNLAALAEDSLVRWGEHPVLAVEGREWTNIDMQREAARLAHGLVALGLAPGDRVVVLLPNCPEVLQAYAAILKLGGVIVPVVFLLSPEEVRHILADSGARIVVTAPELLARIEGWTGTVILVGDGTGARPWGEVVAGRPDAFPSLPRADGDPADGEVVVFGRAMGDRQSNIDRWRGQFAPVAKDADRLEEIAAGEKGKVHLLDITGKYSGGMAPAAGAPAPPTWDGQTRMFAAVVEVPAGTYYVKATGPAATMGKWEKTVREFIVESAKK